MSSRSSPKRVAEPTGRSIRSQPIAPAVTAGRSLRSVRHLLPVAVVSSENRRPTGPAAASHPISGKEAAADGFLGLYGEAVASISLVAICRKRMPFDGVDAGGKCG